MLNQKQYKKISLSNDQRIGWRWEEALGHWVYELIQSDELNELT
jgi:hypothetical protein